VCEIAKRLGFADAFSFSSAADVFREHAALSAFENQGARDFDLGGLAALSDAQYAGLDPVQWPLPEPVPASMRGAAKRDGDKRLFAGGGFFTPDRKARFIEPLTPAPKEPLSSGFPFRLNTGRLRDQWHTMTRSGTSPRLAGHCPEPFVAVHPDDATERGLVDGGFAQVTTRFGSCVLKVAVDAGQRPGSLFAPIHWSDATASAARICDLVMPDTDPLSGQPEAKATPAAVAPLSFRSRGFAVTRDAIALPPGTWWVRVALTDAVGLLFATNEAPQRWRERAQDLFGGEVALAEYVDEPRLYRVAAFRERRLIGCLFIGPEEAAPQWDAVKASFMADPLADHARRVLLSGRSAQGLIDTGPLVCTCFGVGLNAIRAAIATRAAANVDDIGRALKAGTNCGSCLPELKRIVNDGVAAL